MSKHLLVFSIICLIFMGITGCEERDKIKEINLQKKETLITEGTTKKERHLRVAIGSMITPVEGYSYYRNLADYIGAKMGIPVEIIDRDNYQEINSLLETNNVDVAFVCGRPYVEAHDNFGAELLAAPEVNGKTEYYSYTIVHIDSPVKTFYELRGRTFAFADPQSNSGKLVPTYMLSKINETPDSFFKDYIYTFAHDKSIKAVAQKLVDGAAVDSLIWEYYNKFNPEITSKTKVINQSPPYGIPPVVVPSGIDPEMKSKLKNIFLNLHKDIKSKKILQSMMIEKFTEVDDKQYNSIREMIVFTEQNKMVK